MSHHTQLIKTVFEKKKKTNKPDLMVVLGPHRACSSPANIVSIGQNVRPNEFSGAHGDSST